MQPNFQKLLTRKHSTLTDDILSSAWNDKDRFVRLVGIKEYMQNLEIIDGDFYFDINWVEYIIEKYKNHDINFFKNFIKEGYKHGEKFKQFSRELNLNKDIDELIKSFQDSVELMKNLLVFLPETHPLSKIIENKLVKILKNKGISENRINELLITISTPVKFNTPVLEIQDLKHIYKEKEIDHAFDISKALDEHTEKYSFLGYREPFSQGYTKDFFEERLKTIDKEEENADKTVIDIKFMDDETNYVNLMKEFVYFRNYRTEKLYEGLFYIESLWKKISEHYNLNHLNDLGYYSLEETNNLFENNIKVVDNTINDRKKGYGFLLHNNTTSLIIGNELSLKKQSLDKTGDDTMDIKGMVARKGITKGVVKIVLKASEQSKVSDGDVLVTTMTTPDFIPAMKKASAFITDEGGITCHAAIVAREIGKPCIIGTKIATKVLKDGMRVEVDANNGVVKILKQAK
ncbi:MAG: PEP-utilizing enzyme [SAR202 cluster bacterium]|jgi:phosphoenolpyruvate synthase/pyruvate phosphate dikinase|nr:PEP-utilizing enzyme [SAR202 cluster bacterium]